MDPSNQLQFMHSKTEDSLIDSVKLKIDEAIADIDNGQFEASLPSLVLYCESQSNQALNSNKYVEYSTHQKLHQLVKSIAELAGRFQEQLSFMKSQLASETLTHQATLRNFREHTVGSNGLSQRLESALNENSSLIQKHQQEVSTNAIKTNALQERVSNLETERNQLQEKNSILEAKCSSLASQLSASKLPSSESKPSETKLTEGNVTEDEEGLETNKIIGLERDLRLVTELLRTEQEKREKADIDCKKANNELERLKGHLLSVQDQCDEMEMELRNQIEELQKEKANNSSSITKETESFIASIVPADALQKLRSTVEAELVGVSGVVTGEDAGSRIAELEEQNEQYAQRIDELEFQVTNLETAMVQLQTEQQQEINLRTLTIRTQLDQSNQQIIQYEDLKQNMQKQILQLQSDLAASHGIQLMLNEEKSRKIQLENENRSLKVALNDAAARLSLITEGRDSTIAKPIVAKIFSGYLSPTTSSASKTELLHLMANILDFSDDERIPLGIPVRHSDNPGGHLLITPAKPKRGIVSAISAATGSMVSGSIQKSKQWWWGSNNNNNTSSDPSNPSSSQAQQSATSNAPNKSNVSIADIWVKLLIEGSESKDVQDTAINQAGHIQVPQSAPSMPTTAFTTTLSHPPTTVPYSGNPSILQGGSTPLNRSGSVGVVPLSSSNPASNQPTSLPHTDPAIVAPLPNSSSYLAQQQAMRAYWVQSANSPSTTPTNPTAASLTPQVT